MNKKNRRASGVSGLDYDVYNKILTRLEDCRIRAPEGTVKRVMAALPEAPDAPWFKRVLDLWPSGGRWVMPAMAGAVAALMLFAGHNFFQINSSSTGERVAFELHAPDARSVQVVGSFNKWRADSVFLKGPNRTGHIMPIANINKVWSESCTFIGAVDTASMKMASAGRIDWAGHIAL